MLVQANLFISSALSSFDAQRWRPTTSFCATMSPHDVVNISNKRGLKCPKKPQNSPFCSALPSIVSAWAPPMVPSLIPATKSGELVSPICVPTCFTFSQIARNLRYSARLAYLVASSSQAPHKASLWLTRGCLRQKRRRLEWSLAALISSLNCDYHLATAPTNVFIFVRILVFTTPIL